MDTKITIIDENEERVEITGNIIIIRETQEEFMKELSAIIDKYAI